MKQTYSSLTIKRFFGTVLSYCYNYLLALMSFSSILLYDHCGVLNPNSAAGFEEKVSSKSKNIFGAFIVRAISKIWIVDHPLSSYAKFYKKSNICYPLIFLYVSICVLGDKKR